MLGLDWAPGLEGNYDGGPHILSCFELAGRPAVCYLYSCSLPSSACCRLGGPAGMLH